MIQETKILAVLALALVACQALVVPRAPKSHTRVQAPSTTSGRFSRRSVIVAKKGTERRAAVRAAVRPGATRILRCEARGALTCPTPSPPCR